MSSSNVSVLGLVASSMLILVAIGVSLWRKLGLEVSLLVAAGRAALQLLAVGLLLALVVNDDDHPEAPGHDWCTSCGICAKVCPPQCIWIVRGSDPETGRPVPEPKEFYIDIDICMNCGYCAEFCPFDAIKMDHDYEIASYDRTTHHVHDKARLSRPLSYWQTIAPTRAEQERLAREAKEAAKAVRKARR